jgi:hypothetical protein
VKIVTWYDIVWDGSTYVENLSGADEKILTGLGIHGYATEAEAKANPQTMNDIQAAAGGANVLAGAVALPGVIQPGAIAGGAGTVAAGATSVLGFLQGLFTRANAIRLAEGVLGIVLVVVAVAELSKGTPLAGIAKKAALM